MSNSNNIISNFNHTLKMGDPMNKSKNFDIGFIGGKSKC